MSTNLQNVQRNEIASKADSTNDALDVEYDENYSTEASISEANESINNDIQQFSIASWNGLLYKPNMEETDSDDEQE